MNVAETTMAQQMKIIVRYHGLIVNTLHLSKGLMGSLVGKGVITSRQRTQLQVLNLLLIVLFCLSRKL